MAGKSQILTRFLGSARTNEERNLFSIRHLAFASREEWPRKSSKSNESILVSLTVPRPWKTLTQQFLLQDQF